MASGSTQNNLHPSTFTFRLIPDFVTEEEETELLETFRWEENDGRMKHRQVDERLTVN